MEIRYINSLDDRNELSNIYEQSWRKAYRGIIPQDYLDAIPIGHWNENFDIPGWRTVVCVEDGKFIATSSFSKSRFDQYSDLGEIISIYLLPEYIKKGYGSKLLDFVLYELYQEGYKEIFLWVLEENTNARKFYESKGFILDKEYLNDKIGGKELKEVRYFYQFPSEMRNND